MHQDGSLGDVKKGTPFPQHNYYSTVADKLVLLNPLDEITICLLFNELFIRCFKLICTARVIDCKHRPQ